MLSLSASLFTQQIQQWRARVGDDSVDATLDTLSQADPGHRGPTDISDWA